MIAFVRIVATGFLAYVLFAGYFLFAASPAGGVTGTVAFFLSAIVGWLLAFFGGEVAELFDLPPFNTVVRGAGVLLLLILAVVAFTQRQPNLSLNRTPLGGACAPSFGSPVSLVR